MRSHALVLAAFVLLAASAAQAKPRYSMRELLQDAPAGATPPAYPTAGSLPPPSPPMYPANLPVASPIQPPPVEVSPVPSPTTPTPSPVPSPTPSPVPSPTPSPAVSPPASPPCPVNRDLDGCTVQWVPMNETQCYESCTGFVTLMQRVVTCPLVERSCPSVQTCPPPPSPPPPSPPPPSPPPPSPPPPPPSPPPPAPPLTPIGGGVCTWTCDPCATCQWEPNFNQCISYGGNNGEDVGVCRMDRDCIFSGRFIPKDTNLNDVNAMPAGSAKGPTNWPCTPSTPGGAVTAGAFHVCSVGQCKGRPAPAPSGR